MNYELGKKLKDAGFPTKTGMVKIQSGDCFYKYISREYIKTLWCDKEDYILMRDLGEVYIPTLEELIEACGNDFVTLDKEGKVWEAWGKYYCCDEHGEGRKNERGSTPLIAVANLWLALHRESAPHQEGMIGYIHEKEKS